MILQTQVFLNNMYKFILILVVSFFSAQQKCNLSFANNTLSKDGTVTLIIKNQTKRKLKVPIQYKSEWARPTDVQIYNEEKKSYEYTGYSFDGASCLDTKKCLGKTFCLKNNKIKEYKVKVIPGRISQVFEEKKKYRFKLAFDTYLFSNCEEYLTDWFYYDLN